MAYVQEMFDLLVEEEEKMPWLVIVTLTGLPVTRNRDDSIIVEGS